jgi:magnesium-dependent phosphatase 1
MLPKLIAFETSGVLFQGSLHEDQWGKGSGASLTLADNVTKVEGKEWVLKDRSNHQNKVKLCADVPKIVRDLVKNDVLIAIVSRKDNKELVDRVLYHFTFTDPKANTKKSIIYAVNYDEVKDEVRTKHFARIHNWSSIAYKDMLYFDKPGFDDGLASIGILVHTVDEGGISSAQYEKAIQAWRAKNGMTSIPAAPSQPAPAT